MADAPDTPDPIASALYAGRKIQAIKLHRAEHGGSLADAKAAVEALEAELRQAHPERFAHKAGAGCSSVLLVAGAVGIGVAAALAIAG